MRLGWSRQLTNTEVDTMTVATAPTVDPIAANMPRVLAAMDAINHLYAAEVELRSGDPMPVVDTKRALDLGLLLSLASELDDQRLKFVLTAGQAMWESVYGAGGTAEPYPSPLAD